MKTKLGLAILGLIALFTLGACQQSALDLQAKSQYQIKAAASIDRMAANVSKYTSRGIKRGVGFDTSSYQPYGGSYINPNIEVDLQAFSQLAAAIPVDSANYEKYVVEFFRIVMEVVQYRSMMSTGMYRGLAKDSQKKMQYLWGWNTGGMQYPQFANSLAGGMFPMYGSFGNQGFIGSSAYEYGG